MKPLEHIEIAMLNVAEAGQASRQPWPSSYVGAATLTRKQRQHRDRLLATAYALIESHGVRHIPMFLDFGDAVAYQALCGMIAEVSR